MEAHAFYPPEMRPRGGQWPLSSTMTASNCHAVRGFSDASSSTPPCARQRNTSQTERAHVLPINNKITINFTHAG